LFSKGKSFSVYPFKVLYDFADVAENTLQASVTVSSRNFKKAVERNRVKRIMREAYRLHKPLLQDALSNENKKLMVFFIYVAKELPEFSVACSKMEVALQRLMKEVPKEK